MSHKKNRQYFSEPNCHEVVPSFESKTSKTLRTSSTGKDSEPKVANDFLSKIRKLKKYYLHNKENLIMEKVRERERESKSNEFLQFLMTTLVSINNS